MKACKVDISADLLFELMKLNPHLYQVVSAECNVPSVITLTVTGIAEDIPEVAEGEEIPHKRIEAYRYTSKLV